MKKILSLSVVVAALFGAVGCEEKKPSSPAAAPKMSGSGDAKTPAKEPAKEEKKEEKK